jgi:hypothetical protein
MVSKIKLFENWAEEIEVPEWLDPNYNFKTGYNLVDHVRRNIFNPKENEFERREDLDLNDYNFRSFSDYDFWLDEYSRISVDQNKSVIKLKDFFGIPKTNKLEFRFTDIKTLKGLEGKVFDFFWCEDSYIENLKYLPNSRFYKFGENPLLSYYTPDANSFLIGNLCKTVNHRETNLCGRLLRHVIDDDENYETYTQKHINDVVMNANIFSHYNNKVYNTSTSRYINSTLISTSIKSTNINPWHNIYHDPNYVENYTFLFIPFYENSEKFRDKSHEYFGDDIDLSGVTRNKEELW